MKQRKMKKFIYDLRLLINNHFYFSKSFEVITRCLQSQTKQKQQKVRMKQKQQKIRMKQSQPTEATFYLFFQEIFRAFISFFTRFNRSNTTVRCVRETRQTTLLE